MVHRPEITEYVQRQRSIDRDRTESINNGGREYYTESGKTGKQIKYKILDHKFFPLLFFLLFPANYLFQMSSNYYYIYIYYYTGSQ